MVSQSQSGYAESIYWPLDRRFGKEKDVIVELNEDNFLKEVLGDAVVLLDCYSPWCLPCLRQDEILSKLSGEYKKVKFCKLNTDTNPELADKLKVKSVPTLLFISSRDGGKIEVQVGLKGEERIKSKLEEMVWG